jgi:hypothetical protein
MGIGSNLAVEEAEEKHREQKNKMIINETAQLVVIEKLSREEAFQKAKTSEFNVQITVPPDKEKQVAAVAKELYTQFEYDLD